ncbi:unnamed protein product [Lasius platythorax]|uniref:Uncharacterized protein n=1 Tax=Lasius platythorax TaxID=488582 RepID=A0AAV2NTH0_9HYME
MALLQPYTKPKRTNLSLRSSKRYKYCGAFVAALRLVHLALRNATVNLYNVMKYSLPRRFKRLFSRDGLAVALQKSDIQYEQL